MIAERLTKLRLDSGLSQKDVAAALHISRGAYSSYETGRRTPPLDTLVQLAQYFHTTTDYLLGSTDMAAQPPRLDEQGMELIRLYQEADPRGQATILYMALQEKLQFGQPEETGSSGKTP